MSFSGMGVSTHSTTGSRIGTNKNITFTGSGEFANGWTFGILHTMNDAMSGQSSSSMNISMGGIITIAYDSGTGGYGANAVDNIVPTAWEEVDAGFATGLTDVGAVSKQHGVINITAKAPGSGSALSLSYVPRFGASAVADGGTSGDSNTAQYGIDAVLDLWNINTTYFGLRTGAAAEKVSHQNCRDTATAPKLVQENCIGQKGDAYAATIYQTLRVGPLSAGFQATYKDPGTAGGIENNQAYVAGVALTVGDTISLSVGKGYDEYYNSSFGNSTEGIRARDVIVLDVDRDEFISARYWGYSASINLGPIALKGYHNKARAMGGSYDSNIHNGRAIDRSEVNLSMAF